MPVKLSEEICVVIEQGGEDVKAYFPPGDDPLMIAAVKKLVSTRTKARRGGSVVDKSFDARCTFFDSQCIRVENVEAKNAEGQYVPIVQIESWKGKIPPNWKLSFAIHFEEQATLSEDQVGNFDEE